MCKINNQKKLVMPLSIICLKAYGDFVIACNLISKITTSNNKEKVPNIIANEHLRDLALALKFDNIQFIGNDLCKDVPPAFDFRKHGTFAALKSLWMLRKSIATLSQIQTLIFDHLHWREFFIGYKHQLIKPPIGAENIYLGYEQLLKSLDYEIFPETLQKKFQAKKIIIIPGSRLLEKKIPVNIIENIIRQLKSRAVDVEIIALEDENIESSVNYSIKRIPRNFESLISSIKEADLVISADSLPSHLSEFFNIPIFVVTPIENRYWLPKSAFLSNGWASFGNLNPLNLWLNNYLIASNKLM